MWRIFNLLFGWDYIYWTNCVDHGIAKIYVDGEGNPYYYRYKLTGVIDLANGTVSTVLWLTCPKSKYYKED